MKDMKARVFCLICAGCLLCGSLCACEPHYYREESSETPSAEEISDPTPAFVFGETGFYDTENDREYRILSEYVLAKEKGEEYCVGGGHTFFRVVGEAEEYLLCDENMRVYGNTDLPFLYPWEDADFASHHPGLDVVQDGED